MTTTEILEMALRVTDLGRPPNTIARVSLRKRHDGGVRIEAEPSVVTDDLGPGRAFIFGDGADIDAAALAMLPTIRDAEEAIRVRVKKLGEREAARIVALDAATGGGR